MPFFPAEQDWTLTLDHRPSRIPLDEQFLVKYAVNSIPISDPKVRQQRKGPNNVGKLMPNNPNQIPILEKNRYGHKEPGELANDEEGIPSWVCEPMPPLGNTE